MQRHHRRGGRDTNRVAEMCTVSPAGVFFERAEIVLGSSPPNVFRAVGYYSDDSIRAIVTDLNGTSRIHDPNLCC
jgi:hypothetical protein